MKAVLKLNAHLQMQVFLFAAVYVFSHCFAASHFVLINSTSIAIDAVVVTSSLELESEAFLSTIES